MSKQPSGPSRARTLRTSVITLALAAALCAPSVASAATLVYIDPGHGGRYNHARAYGLVEKNVNLWLGLTLRSKLEADGFEVGMTRDTDRSLSTSDINTWKWDSKRKVWRFARDGKRLGDPPIDDLQARVNKANAAGADVFISIHNNGSRSRVAAGTETWSAVDDDLGRSLGRYVQTAMIEQTGMRNRGAKSINFYVLRWSNMPAILIEGGFLTNRADAVRLNRASFRHKMMQGVVIGLKRWLATDPFKRIYPRIGGSEAAEVAASASAARFAAGVGGPVVVVSSDDPTSGVTAAPLARRLGAPLLVASASGVPTATAVELARIAPASIVAVAPQSALPDSVLSGLAAAAGTAPATRRIAGADAYETAALVASEIGVPADGRIVLASGESFADALSASVAVTGQPAPVLLTAPGPVLSGPAADFLFAHSGEVSRTIIVGGVGSVWPEIASQVPGPARIDGVDRFMANTSVIATAHPTCAVAPIVTGWWPDASGIVAAAEAGAANRPLLLTGGRVLSSYSRLWITNNHNRITNYTIVGTDDRHPALEDAILRKATH